MANALKIHATDNVAVALTNLQSGTRIALVENGTDRDICAIDPIPFGHKIALTRIPRGAEVIKYGAPIGLAREEIDAGQHVHVHNLESVRGAALS